MHGTAHISFAGGGLILPAHTPYERELLFEHVEASARQHEQVELKASGRHWMVEPLPGKRRRCAGCARPLRGLTYTRDGQCFCGECVRHAMQ